MVGKIQAEKLIILSPNGKIETHFYRVPNSTSTVIFVGGCGGGWHNPNQGYMYPSLCTKLTNYGISALHLKYRNGGDLEECTYDVLETLKYLKNVEQIRHAGIVGWSFGGAVVCQGAGKSDTGIVKAIATLATQSSGVEPIRNAKNVASLFIHGNEDTCLPTRCSEFTYRIAPEPKKLMVVNDHHGFFSTSKEVENEIIDLFRKYLIEN